MYFTDKHNNISLGTSQSCKKTKLHELTKLHEDKFTRRVNFVGTQFAPRVNFKE